MTVHQFRRMALSLPEVEARAHMQHPDFRVGGKVFATLGYPDGLGHDQADAGTTAVLRSGSPLRFRSRRWRLGTTRMHARPPQNRGCRCCAGSDEGSMARPCAEKANRADSNQRQPAPSPQPLAPYFLGTQVNSPQAVCWTRQVLTLKLRKDSEWPVIFRDVRESTSKRTVREQSLVSFPGGALGIPKSMLMLDLPTHLVPERRHSVRI